MLNKIAISLSALLLVLLTASHLWAQDIEAGKRLYGTCQSCHGASGEGNQLLRAPSLAGAETWSTTRQLQNFRAAIRGGNGDLDPYGAMMYPMALNLSDDDIINVAAYLKTLPKSTPKATVVADVKAGQTAYLICSSCHGASGEGNELLNSPSLDHLPDWYIVQQLNNFKSGARGANPKNIYGLQMRPMSLTLPTPEAVDNVAAYISTLSNK